MRTVTSQKTKEARNSPERINYPKSQLTNVEKSLKELEAKSLEMSRCLENIRNERSRLEDSKMNMNTINFDYDYEKLKQEYSTLKSDNIIFREDINRLSEINRHLEEELGRQRNRK